MEPRIRVSAILRWQGRFLPVDELPGSERGSGGHGSTGGHGVPATAADDAAAATREGQA